MQLIIKIKMNKAKIIRMYSKLIKINMKMFKNSKQTRYNNILYKFKIFQLHNQRPKMLIENYLNKIRSNQQVIIFYNKI